MATINTEEIKKANKSDTVPSNLDLSFPRNKVKCNSIAPRKKSYSRRSLSKFTNRKQSNLLGNKNKVPDNFEENDEKGFTSSSRKDYKKCPQQSSNHQLLGKNHKHRENNEVNNKKLVKNTFNTLDIIEELRLVVKDETACDFEKISEILCCSDIIVDHNVLINLMDLVKKLSITESTRKLEILQLVVNKHFLDAILKFTQQNLRGLIKSASGSEICEKVFFKFLDLSRVAIRLLPVSSLHLLKHTLECTKATLYRVRDRINISLKHFEELEAQIEENAKKEEFKKEEESLLDTDKMKNMSVLPTVEDLFGRPPDLKKNIVEGVYKSADHYLTVQFTLLHEDFIAPLREGVVSFLSSPSGKKKTQVAICHHVRITHASTSTGKFGYVVQLDRKIKWEVISQFLIFGSLLLFTTDNFKSFFIGIVIDANKGNRTINVKLNSNHTKVCCDIYAHEYIMAISKVYFEPYYHVLNALQEMASEEFPMKKYIVEVCPEPQPPAYIRQLGLDKYKISEQTYVDILKPCWSEASMGKLNPSQCKAFQAALTKEFVAIQGPPGTGKTFLGLQIVSALINNVHTGTPILIVCYKNHALDQFLEGILDNITDKIIRIGGRSKNEKLKGYNLKDCRGRYGFWLYEEFLKDLATAYFWKQYQINSLKKHGIVSLQNLLPYVGSSKFRAELMRVNLEDWLMEGMYINEEYEDDMVVDDVVYQNKTECNRDSNKEVDLKSDEDYEQLDNQTPDSHSVGFGNSKDNYCGYSPHDPCLDFNAFSESEETKDQKDNITCMLDDQSFMFSEESKKRIEEMYTDDYSNIYCDVSKEVGRDLLLENSGDKRKSLNFGLLEPHFTLTFQLLKDHVLDYERRLQLLLANIDIDDDERNYWQLIWETNIEDLSKRISFLKRMLGKKIDSSLMNIEKLYEMGEHFGVGALSNDQRWFLYHSWIRDLEKDIRGEMIKLEESIRFGEERLDKARGEANLAALKKVKVVGVTTSGAAKNRSTLNKLGANIVLIEEAAEVLESHIVTSLSSKCKHLILIGDHKQLRPNPGDYKLCTKYNFNVSLFERMVRNGLSCHTLNVQHRMRPEFASLIVPSIYEHLENHTSTENRPDIGGLHKNLYFITHNHHEKKLQNSQSHVNIFEAEFVIHLAEYLFLQGYSTDEITILATYSGQVKKMIKMRDQRRRDLRITTVDDFQGEENKIIILSLVRSNEEGNIGFLKIENRVCVALSRAREGLYIVGNMDILAKNSQIWPKVKERLVEHDALGETLSVYCQNHKETVTNVNDGVMFRQMPEGGCLRMCETKLLCSHVCKYHCHPRDQEHKTLYKCSMPCERKLCKMKHSCPKICGEDCGDCKVTVEFVLACGHKKRARCTSDPIDLLTLCKVDVPYTHPCGHVSTKLCSESLEEAGKRKCQSVCSKALRCGHTCGQLCGHWRTCDFYPCTITVEATAECGHKVMAKCSEKSHICYKKVEKTLPCGHTHFVFCFNFEEFQECSVEMEKTLKCGHTQLIQCTSSTHQVFCPKLIIKTLSCGHQMEVICSFSSEQSICQQLCLKILSCGHHCQNKCSESCFCSFIVMRKLYCGHSVMTKCGFKDIICNHPCERVLACGHVCQLKCGVKCVSQCMILTPSKVNSPCGHGPVIAPCFLNKMGPEILLSKLAYKCKAECGAELPCKDVCTGECWNCTSTNRHAVCNKPCRKTLSCGHKCPKKCWEECGGCFEKCLNKCSHKSCNRVCGEPCDICQEPCDRGCVHKRCSKPCFAFCNRRPCSLSCTFPLVCGHPCLGFCGELCPPLCMQCDPQSVLAIGGNPTSRFVVLEDCGHVVDAARMDAFICRFKYCILKCPIVSCQTPIVTTKRYHYEVIEAFSSIMKLKREMDAKESSNLKSGLNERMSGLRINEERIPGSLSYQSSRNVAPSRNPDSRGEASLPRGRPQFPA